MVMRLLTDEDKYYESIGASYFFTNTNYFTIEQDGKVALYYFNSTEPNQTRLLAVPEVDVTSIFLWVYGYEVTRRKDNQPMQTPGSKQ